MRSLLVVSALVIASTAVAIRPTVQTATGTTPTLYACPSTTGSSVLTTISMTPCEGGSAAVGSYVRSGNTTGWNVLNIETNGTFSDDLQAYGAGQIEGYGSAEDIVNFHDNTLGANGFAGPVSQKIQDWINNNDQYMQKMVNASASTDPYWRMVGLLLQQIAGMIEGVQTNGYPNYTRLQFLISLAMPDVISDLQVAYPDPKNPPRYALTDNQRLHCSSIVKVTDDLSNILFGHVTWMQFNTMLRVFKMVTFNFNSVDLKAKTISYSGYPGTIASTDDFYALSSGFGVMETSLSIYNLSLYNVLTPNSLLSSMRTSVANRLASNGSQWADLFARENSGTYNNQWMVIDMNLFTPGKDLQPNTLWIVEQLPGLVEGGDFTHILQFGYWPSYNIPFSKNVFDLAGYPSQLPQGAAFNDYQLACRAQLFRQLQGSITDIPSLQNVLQYNQYETNPLEHKNPGYAISSRYDLSVEQPLGFGGLDCKVTSYNDYFVNNSQKVYAFSGPTPQQATFAFNTSKAAQLEPHVGLPTVFDFKWESYTPSSP